jgi:hypothetical protein
VPSCAIVDLGWSRMISSSSAKLKKSSSLEILIVQQLVCTVFDLLN